MSVEKSKPNFNVTSGFTRQERIAMAAANWVRMGIPIRLLENGKEIKDPRTPLERKDPVATYFALRQLDTELALSVITGPESGILAIDAYTTEPGFGLEALEKLGFFCGCCHADALIRHESLLDNVVQGGFHTVLFYAGKQKFLETNPEELPGVTIRKSGERIILPPYESKFSFEERILSRSSYEADGVLAPAGIAYLPKGLRNIIRKAERQTMKQTKPPQKNGGVGSELFTVVLEGSRNTELTKRAGFIIGQIKLSLDETIQTLQEINRRCCRPPLKEEEVRSIARSIYKRHHRNG